MATTFGALLLLLPAIYNGYPLVNSDDGTYLGSGFKIENPGDRPITYGLFLNVFSLNGLSLWIAVSFQTLILSWLIVKTLRHVTGENHLIRNSLITFAILALTSLSWTASEVIPDIWMPIALLAFSLIASDKEGKFTTVFLYVLYFCSVATHMSHLMIFTVIIIMLLCMKRFFFLPEHTKRVNITLLLLILVTWSSFAVMVSPYSKSKHVFMMASMIEKGILKKYLDEHCASKHFKICEYSDNLPTDPNVFIWDNNSPLYKEGGWEATKKEYTEIINGTLTEPKYITLHIQESLKATWRQLFECHIAEGNFPFPKGTHVYAAIKEYAPNDTGMYSRAWQHEVIIKEHVNAMNSINYFLSIGSLPVIILVLVIGRKKLGFPAKLFLFLLIAGFLVNIWNCATFAQVNARYCSRMVWALPFAAMLGIFTLNNSYQKKV